MFDGQSGPYEFERKFLLEADRAHAFWSCAAAHLPRDHEAPPCHVRTTYFDTPDLAFHRSSGGEIRRRLRVREYAQSDGDFTRAARCYLELKQSSDSVRKKLRVEVAPEDVTAHLIAIAGAPMLPCVATLYRRRALGDGELRITLDEQLLLCRPRPLGSSLLGLRADDVLARGPSFVLELKFSERPPPWLAEALTDLREAVGFSKFILGMSAALQTHEDLRISC